MMISGFMYVPPNLLFVVVFVCVVHYISAIIVLQSFFIVYYHFCQFTQSFSSFFVHFYYILIVYHRFILFIVLLFHRFVAIMMIKNHSMILHYEISLRKGRTLMAKQTTDSFPEEREEIILDNFKKARKSSCHRSLRYSIDCTFNCPPSLARNARQRLIAKNTRCAIPIDRPETPKVSRDFSQIEHYEDKLKIALLAASTIKNGDYITIGSGTTTYLLATLLHGKKILPL